MTTRVENGIVLFLNEDSKLHRIDGPALIDSNTGATAHYLHGVLLRPREHRWLRRRNALLRDAPKCIIEFM